MACLFKKEFNLGEVTPYFWTDSKVVLSYIRNDTSRFKTFVANRIYQIKENTNAEQWSYIPTRENRADDVPRGLSVEWTSSIVVGFKDFHSYGKKKNIGQIKINQ